jgi:hypothetical protein
MAEDFSDWAAEFNTTEDIKIRFAAIAGELGLSPSSLIGSMVDQVVQIDERLLQYGRSLTDLITKTDLIDYAVQQGLDALPINIRPTSFMWPDDKLFPWTADECRAAVIGYEVKWPGEFEDFCEKLRGLWEMSDGYAFLKQS